MPTKLLTVKETAAVLRKHPETVRILLRAGDLTGTQQTTHSPWLITEAAIANYVRKYTR